MRSFVNYAHRGAPAYRPENTKISFDYGLELGANGIETDIQMTKDGVAVLFHDDIIDNKSDANGKIIDYTYGELLEMDFGSWFDTKFAGERILTLEDFADEYFSLPITFAIELKSSGAEQATMNIVDKYNAADKCIITSFCFDYLVKTRELNKGIRIGYLVKKINEQNLTLLKSIDGYEICPEAQNTTAQDVALAGKRGFETRLWGIYDEKIMCNALTLGINGMTCNFPDKLTEALKTRNIVSSQKK